MKFLTGFVSLLVFNFLVFAPPVWASEAGSKEKPSLVVVIAVDQLRRDRLLDSFEGGLGRLMKEGRVFSRAQLNHGITNTCPGHAVMLTGVNPGKAGIPDSYYVDRQDWEVRYCVSDKDQAHQVLGRQINRSPENLKVTTLGDWLKSDDENTRVFAVGGKDRAVITLGGQHPDGAFWFDAVQGIFTTSRYYADAVHAYIEKYNGGQPLLDGYLSTLPKTWIHPGGTVRPDAYPGEDEKFGNTSGHPLNQGEIEEVGEQVYHSPYVDSASLELVAEIIRHEKLGQGGGTDLLAVALSATDSVGHLYGPFSAESEATLRNLDIRLGGFLAFLDQKVGEDNYILVLTADPWFATHADKWNRKTL